MTKGTDDTRRANLVGSIWMVGAMACFAIEDSFVKLAATVMPVGQILMLFGMGGALVFAVLARRRGGRLFVADALSRPMRYRVLFEITGRLFYILAIALIPLSTATVILQATPLVVVAGAAVLFKEQVGWRRWTAIGLGMLGVIVIVQPGAEGFSALSVLALIGMLGFAGRDLASRAAPASLSTAVLGFYGFASVCLAGVLYAAYAGAPFVVPDTITSFYLMGAIVFGVAAYACLMKAMRTGEVSAVTPFRYSRLLIGVAIGVLVFGEKISSEVVLGSCLIVSSGLFILWRGKKAT